MDATALPPDQAILGILSAAILAGLKALAPQIQKQIPGFIWPLAVLILARLGTALCHTVGAACTGNPMGWGVADTNLLAAGFIAIVAREATVWGKNYMSTIISWIQKHLPGPGGAASGVLIFILAASTAHAINFSAVSRTCECDARAGFGVICESPMEFKLQPDGVALVFDECICAYVIPGMTPYKPSKSLSAYYPCVYTLGVGCRIIHTMGNHGFSLDGVCVIEEPY